MSNTIKDAMKKAGVKNGKGSSLNARRRKPPAPAVSALKKGKIKWFNIGAGYGFITGEDGKDYFVHFSKINVGRNYLGFNAGDEVTFRINHDPNTDRIQAVNISLDLPDDERASDKSREYVEPDVEPEEEEDPEAASDTEDSSSEEYEEYEEEDSEE